MTDFRYYICLPETSVCLKPLYELDAPANAKRARVDGTGTSEGEVCTTLLSDYSRVYVFKPLDPSAPEAEKKYVQSCISAQTLYFSLHDKMTNMTVTLGLEKSQDLFLRRVFVLENVSQGGNTLGEDQEILKNHAKDVSKDVEIEVYHKRVAAGTSGDIWGLERSGKDEPGSEDSTRLMEEASNNPMVSPVFEKKGLSPVFHDKGRVVRTLEMYDCQEVKDLLTIAKEKLSGEKSVLEMTKAMKHPLIVVEGMDAAGKTTLVEKLAKKLEGQKLSSPIEIIRNLRAFFDKSPEIVRRAYYTLGNYISAQELATKCESQTVVVDRYWHSSAAYGIANETSSADLPPEGHAVYSWPDGLLKPSVVIFLTVTEEVRQQRLQNRGGGTATFEEKILSRDRHIRDRLCKAYKRMREPQVVEVDAGGTEEEVMEEVVRKLKELGITQ